MKFLNTVIILSLIFGTLLACKDKGAPEIKMVETQPTAEASTTVKVLNPDAVYAKAEFGIEGMTCAIGCAATIQKEINKMAGVKSAKVDFDNKLAMVEYDEEKVNPKLLTETVTSVSETYTVNNMKIVESFSMD